MHLTDGEIQAYQDGELAAPEQTVVGRHLTACSECRRRSEDLQARSRRVAARLALLNPSPLQASQGARTARARLEERLNRPEKEHENMFTRVFNKIPRPVWAALTLAVVLVVALAFPPVQAIANNFLGLFRVRQISVVQVDPGALPEQLGSSERLSAFFSDNVQIEERGGRQEVATAEEASQKAGFPVRLPTSVQGEQSLVVQPGGLMTFDIDLRQVQGVLDEIGRSDIRLPAELDGQTVTVEVPLSLEARYGGCQPGPEAMREAGYDPDDPHSIRTPDCTTLIQAPSPLVSAPDGLDLNGLGQAFLQVMGMNPDEATRFAQNVDWTSTFVVPIPRYGTSYQEVQVDGVTGTFIARHIENHPDAYLLMWVKDDLLYALAGPGDLSAALAIAGSMP